LNQRTIQVLIAAVLVLSAIAGCSTVSPTPSATQPAPTQITSQATVEPTEDTSQATSAPTEAAGQAASTAQPSDKKAVPAPAPDGSRPLAQVPPADRADRFSGPAPMSIEPNQVYVATIVTPKGNIVAELYTDTPESVNNFVTLAQNGFYDDLTFHRVEPGFVIQGGDPRGSGVGGPGYTIPAEIKHNLADTPFLDGAYTVFGQVIEGMDVAEKIGAGDKIERIDIGTAQASRMPTPAPTPEPKAPVAEEGRPLAKLPVEQREKLYNTAPSTTVDPNKSYQATIKTPKGDVVIDLDAKAAPATVGNFVLLANLGYYDGMPIAYLQTDSYAVLGSPKAQPGSDVGYALALEPSASASPVITGTVTMYPSAASASSEPKASGSQFFISFVQPPSSTAPLNSFGKVTSGLDILKELKKGDVIESVKISEK
jgi:cyclophilin family peptidyl-prolyl cis-trans isomerase